MKKLLALLTVLLLLLAGCANGDAEQTDSIPLETTPAGYYDENSQLEVQTSGAVRQYTLPNTEYLWIKSVGDRLLLASRNNPSELLLLSGDTCIPVGTQRLDVALLENCQPLFNGLAYYDAANHTVVFLDTQLRETHQISLPADATSPVVSQDGKQIYYCMGNEIRAVDITRKLSRLVKTQNVEKQTLVGTCFDGKILVCNAKNATGVAETLYISTENGQTLKKENDIRKLYTYENSYLAERMDGVIFQRIVGTLNGEAKHLNTDDAYLADALELGGVIGYGNTNDGLQLNFYDISSGKKTAAVTLPAVGQPQAVLADKWSGCVWLMVSDPAAGGVRLLRWNVKLSQVKDDGQYLGTLYTTENPDTAALDVLSDRISSLNKKYGVRIRIWKDAVKSSGNHTLVPEHQPAAITDMLDQLQSVLAEFPKSFISKSISSKVRISLVRSVDGESKGAQFWDGSNAYIALSTQCDIRSEFLKAFGFVVDSHVLGNSPKYDYWDTLNPPGFLYGGEADLSLISGENRFFIDAESMKSGTVDRSRVFWQAMLSENADVFKGETMQKKLTMLCKAIRDAWNLEKSKEIYPWEQYLTKPIAKK